MRLDENELKNKKGILRAYEGALDAMENKLNEEEERIKKLPGQKKAHRRISAWRIMLAIFIIVAAYLLFGSSNPAGRPGVYYVKVATANIRQCPSTDCAVIDTFPQNSLITTPYKTLADAPDWVEIKFTNDKNQSITGHISKSTLSVMPVSE